MTDFPSSLPTDPIASSWREVLGERTLTSEVEEGPPKVRLLNTAAPTTITAEYIYTSDQVTELEDHYKTDAANFFNWTHGRTREATSVRYVKPPESRGIGAGLFSVTLSLETLV